MIRWNIRSIKSASAIAVSPASICHALAGEQVGDDPPDSGGRQITAAVAQGHRRRTMLIVEELDRLFVDLHVLAVGDGRRLGRAHEMAPAPRKAGGVELLEGGLMVLEGVHLSEV